MTNDSNKKDEDLDEDSSDKQESEDVFDEKLLDKELECEDSDHLTQMISKNKAKSSLLNESHRNSSQIWYAKSEAAVLCLDEDENGNENA